MKIREAEPDDLGEIVEVCTAALRWDPADPNEEWFWWKHQRNPFGASPIWVGLEAGRIVAVRAFMQWRFRRDGETVTAARAVDTATLPSHRRLGLFSRLTMHGLDELQRRGVSFVFNTPNDQSRPGYLSLGWRELGPAPISVRPGGLASLGRTLRSRTTAAKWSLPTDVGIAVVDLVQSAPDQVAALVESVERADGALWTDRTPEYLAWRYGFGPLHYRTMTLGDIAEGLVVFRLRSRGPSTECAICEVLVPGPNPKPAVRMLLRRLRREVRADHLIASASVGGGVDWVPAGRLGPVVTVRDGASPAPSSISELDLAIGDLELF